MPDRRAGPVDATDRRDPHRPLEPDLGEDALFALSLPSDIRCAHVLTTEQPDPISDQPLKVFLLLRGKRRIVVINIPWYLEED